MKSSGLARVIECSCLVWRRKNCFQVSAFRSSRRMSQQGHLFRHSFLQGTVTTSQSGHLLGAPVFLSVSHTPEVRGRTQKPCPGPLFTSTGDHCLKPQAGSAEEKGVLKSVSKPPPLLCLFCAGPAYSLEEGGPVPKPLTWEPQGSHISAEQLHPSACPFNLAEFCCYHYCFATGSLVAYDGFKFTT